MENVVDSFNMQGKNVVVTGASSGIGRTTAVFLSELGAKVVLVGRREAELQKTKSLLKGNGHVIEVFDLNNFENISVWMKQLAEKVGPLSGLIHSAGMLLVRPIRFFRYEELEQLFSINVYAAIFLTKAFRQKGVAVNESSSIVLLSSVAGILGDSGLSVYAASKGALISFVKAMAVELAKENIRINCVAPAMVKTEMVEKASTLLSQAQKENQFTSCKSVLGQGLPSDVSNAIVFLLSNNSRWITGTTLVVDGGYTAH